MDSLQAIFFSAGCSNFTLHYENIWNMETASMQITKQNTNSSEMYKKNKNTKASALLLTQVLTFPASFSWCALLNTTGLIMVVLFLWLPTQFLQSHRKSFFNGTVLISNNINIRYCNQRFFYFFLNGYCISRPTEAVLCCNRYFHIWFSIVQCIFAHMS